MEHRPYFIFGDMLACVTAGAATGWIVHAAIPGGWPMPLAMLAGMALGMLVGAAFGTMFGPFFGALEVGLPTALAGMLSGSVLAMMPALIPVHWAMALWAGALIGLACMGLTYILQAATHGEVR